MNERELEPTIRRILVALDASPHSQAALEAASELADALKAELVDDRISSLLTASETRVAWTSTSWPSR